jgi:hypothetical protein
MSQAIPSEAAASVLSEAAASVLSEAALATDGNRTLSDRSVNRSVHLNVANEITAAGTTNHGIATPDAD